MGSHPCLCDHAPRNTSHDKAWEAAAAGHTPWPGFTSLPEENRVAGVRVLRLHPQVSCALGWFYSALFCDQVLSPTANLLNLWVQFGTPSFAVGGKWQPREFSKLGLYNKH